MFMFQSDLNFKEVWAGLLGEGKKRGNGEKNRRMKIRRLGDSKEKR